MATNEEPNDPYRRARVIGGVLMLVLVSSLMLLDAWNDAFALDTIQLGLLLGTTLALLGVEGFRAFIR
jgi:hypothetical protein